MPKIKGQEWLLTLWVGHAVHYFVLKSPILVNSSPHSTFYGSGRCVGYTQFIVILCVCNYIVVTPPLNVQKGLSTQALFTLFIIDNFILTNATTDYVLLCSWDYRLTWKEMKANQNVTKPWVCSLTHIFLWPQRDVTWYVYLLSPEPSMPLGA